MMSKRRPQRFIPWLSVSCLSSVTLAAAPLAVSQSELRRCAAIESANERLGCYDQLAGRAPASPDSAMTSAPTAGETPPATPFGLYSAEHPARTKAPAEHSTVVSFGRSAAGHPTVVLEGNQVWEMDAADPLLSPGDVVTITRGTLGSFMMSTPTGRSHRLRRLH